MLTKSYLLQASQEKSGWLVCTDTSLGLVCRFKQGEFNETQKFTLLEDSSPDAQALAKAARRMGDWLAAYHYYAVFGSVLPARLAIGKQIAFIRESKGWTQAMLAEEAGIDQANVCKIEMGRYNTTVDVLGRIADALGCTLTME